MLPFIPQVLCAGGGVAASGPTPAGDIIAMPLYTSVYLQQQITGHTSGTAIVWQAKTQDTLGAWSSITNRSRLTVPSGVSKIRLRAAIRFTDDDPLATMFVRFDKNGAQGPTGAAAAACYGRGVVGDFGNMMTLNSPVLSVTPGDYFEMIASSSSTSTDDLLPGKQYSFSMEKVE